MFELRIHNTGFSSAAGNYFSTDKCTRCRLDSHKSSTAFRETPKLSVQMESDALKVTTFHFYHEKKHKRKVTELLSNLHLCDVTPQPLMSADPRSQMDVCEESELSKHTLRCSNR